MRKISKANDRTGHHQEIFSGDVLIYFAMTHFD